MIDCMDNRKKYNYMENVNFALNKRCITLNDEEIKRNNIILRSLTDILIEKLMESDVLFKKMYKKLYFGGSYYDNLKVGKPEEYDLDLVLSLPKETKPILVCNKLAGYVSMHLADYENYVKFKGEANFSNLSKLLDENYYLINGKVLKWMESILTKVINTFPQKNLERIHTCEGVDYALKIVKGGPAFTLKITSKNCKEDFFLDVDLVPCFVCEIDQLPYMLDQTKLKLFEIKKEFFIVPKVPKQNIAEKERYWRLSFQEQEKVKMEGYQNFKPALRFMKKLRDTQIHNIISSYFIKSFFLFELDKQTKEFWTLPLSFVFVHMLERYHEYLKQNQIPYYWNNYYNLLIDAKPLTIENVCNKIKKIIDCIKNNDSKNPYVLAKFLMSPEELKALKLEMGDMDKQVVLETQSLLKQSKLSGNSDQNISTVLQEFENVLISKMRENNEMVINILENLSSKICDLKSTVEELKVEHAFLMNYVHKNL